MDRHRHRRGAQQRQRTERKLPRVRQTLSGDPGRAAVWGPPSAAPLPAASTSQQRGGPGRERLALWRGSCVPRTSGPAQRHPQAVCLSLSVSHGLSTFLCGCPLSFHPDHTPFSACSISVPTYLTCSPPSASSASLPAQHNSSSFQCHDHSQLATPSWVS